MPSILVILFDFFYFLFDSVLPDIFKRSAAIKRVAKNLSFFVWMISIPTLFVLILIQKHDFLVKLYVLSVLAGIVATIFLFIYRRGKDLTRLINNPPITLRIILSTILLSSFFVLGSGIPLLINLFK